MLGKTIGIMGGTFNPIHTGHLLLAQAALEEAELSEVMFLASGISYLKAEEQVLSAERRLAMTKLAVEDNPAFTVSDMEIRRKGNTYTCDTLRQLRQEAPQNTFYFILGADCLFGMENWYRPQEIFDSCRILAAVRDTVGEEALRIQADRLRERFGADIRLLHLPRVDISSTDIRERVEKGKSIRYMVPEKVRAYILDNNLYQG